MTQADDERFLRKGWDWLEGHADHDPLPENYHALEEAWLKRLRQYEEAYRLVHEPIRSGTQKPRNTLLDGGPVHQSSF